MDDLILFYSCFSSGINNLRIIPIIAVREFPEIAIDRLLYIIGNVVLPNRKTSIIAATTTFLVI